MGKKSVCSQYLLTTNESVRQWCDTQATLRHAMPHVCIGQGQCDRRQAKWITKLLAARSQHCMRLGPHSHRQTCNFVGNGIWPCFIQQQYATYRSGCVRLLSYRTLLALRFQCNDNDTIDTTLCKSRTLAAINSRRHALLQYEHVINCNSDNIWAKMTVSLYYIFKSSAEYSAINYLTWFI